MRQGSRHERPLSFFLALERLEATSSHTTETNSLHVDFEALKQSGPWLDELSCGHVLSTQGGTNVRTDSPTPWPSA
jgi:hypothetical protein